MSNKTNRVTERISDLAILILTSIMPRSKRSKKTPLTKAKKQASSEKGELVDRIREAVDAHESVYALGFQELRATHLQSIRVEFRDSRYGR